jgi:IS30 family transposase
VVVVVVVDQGRLCRDWGAGRIDPHSRRSITSTTTPFAQHGLLRTMRDMTTWLCDAYASWQKGGVESANGRLRRWRELKVLIVEHVSLPHLARLGMELKINDF